IRLSSFILFFQAEDGIRGFHVTGVQTCALPIYLYLAQRLGIGADSFRVRKVRCATARPAAVALDFGKAFTERFGDDPFYHPFREIGRASCRESVYFPIHAESFQEMSSKPGSVSL